MCNFKTYSSFKTIESHGCYPGAAYSCLTADPHPPLQGTFSSREKANRAPAVHYQVLNDRKVIPRTLAPPCRAVIPRTLAPPGSEYDTLLFADANFPSSVAFRASFPPIGGSQSRGSHCSAKPSPLWGEGMRGLPQGSERTPGRNVIPRTLAPPGRTSTPTTSFKSAKPPDSRGNLYPPLLNGGGPLAVEGFKNTYSLDYESPGRLRRPAPFNKGAKGRGSPERIRAPQIRNDMEIIPRIFVPPGAYPPRREESPSG